MSKRSLTLAVARRRVSQVESPSYDVHLDLTDPATATFGSRSTVRFSADPDLLRRWLTH